MIALILLLIAPPVHAEDGYRLWLRYDPLPAQMRQRYKAAATEIVIQSDGLVARSAASELQRGLSGLLATPVRVNPGVDRDGAIVARLEKTTGIGSEGFVIRTTRVAGHRATVISANDERGLLYGSFALLRLIQTYRAVDRLAVTTGRSSSYECSIIGTISIAASSADMRASRCGTGRRCPDRRPPLYRLRPRQRVDRNQRRRPQQRQCRPGNSDGRLFEEGRGDCRPVPP